MQKKEFWRGVRESTPILLGFIPFALVLGAQARGKHFQLFEVPMLTGLNFAGGSEFTAVSLWGEPLNVGLIVAMSVLINSRHIIMGATFSLLLKNISTRKALLILFMMIDESWAMGLAEAEKNQRKNLNLPYYFGCAISLWIVWVGFTTLGAAVAPFIGNLEQYGFDMAFTAVFLVLLKGMWKKGVFLKPWLVSLIVAGLLSRGLAGQWYVLGGVLAGLFTAYWGAKRNGI